MSEVFHEDSVSPGWRCYDVDLSAAVTSDLAPKFYSRRITKRHAPAK
jgi:hypothetical protein